ncbi:MAG: hypothetical protein HYY40_08430 [Bacteroidetes bacterium]|nr:hypothetical protein [Bacteroidota bacterium]
MKKFVFGFQLILLVSISFSQVPHDVQNLEKYWICRERLNNFNVIGNCQGCSAPSNARQGADNLIWADPAWSMGFYIGTLALEYRLLANGGHDLAETRKDLYYAMEAINRLDNTAEQHWSGGCGNSLNGASLAGDVPLGFEENIYEGKTINDYLNESRVPVPDGYRLKCMDTPFNYYDEPREMSKDHLEALLTGLLIVIKILPPTEQWNNTPFADNEVFFVEEAKNIGRRIIDWAYGNGTWEIINPCTGMCVRGVCRSGNPDRCFFPGTTPFDCFDNPNPCEPGGALANWHSPAFKAIFCLQIATNDITSPKYFVPIPLTELWRKLNTHLLCHLTLRNLKYFLKNLI